jgi:UDP-GlcNAc:undecaprenyl-phosphate GlcNAc-1-phosphate transferase
LTPFYLGIFGSALLLSFILTRSVRNLAVSRGWVTPPAGNRHLHVAALPRIGGLAIYLSFLLSIGAAFLVSQIYPRLLDASSGKTILTILIPGTLIFLLGLCDDVYSIGPYAKFAVQAVAATLLFAGGLKILDLPVLFGARHFGWALGLPITIIWVIGITNAFNLIDGLDGLAAGSALFSTMVVFVVAIFSHSSLVSLLTIALAGAVLGFLRFNFNPATIFLGDCGSQFIGFMLSALALQGAQKAPTVIAVAIPVVSFGLPILETALSVLRRFISGRPVFTADREHIHHKLLQRGMSHRQVVIVLYAVSALFALLSLFLLWPTGSTLGLVLAVLGTGIWIGVQHLGYLEFGEIRRVAQRTIEQRSIFINNLSIRRATEELKASTNYDQLCRVLEAAFSSNDFDGFELAVNLLPGDGPPAAHIPSFSTDGISHFRWHKPGVLNLRDGLSAWSLTLDLVTTGNRRRGAIHVYRLYSDRTLLVDINLLTSVFPVALADAIDRAFSSSEQCVAGAATQTDFLAAQAG